MFIGSCSGVAYFFDAGTGEVVWSYDTSQDGSTAQFHGDPLVTDQLVVVGSDARPTAYLYAFERQTGEVRWKHSFPGGVTAQVLGDGDGALVLATDGQLLRIALADGTIEWRHHDPPADAAGARSNDPFLATEGPFARRLFVAWRTGVVEAFDARLGNRLWSRDLGAVLNTSATLFADEVIVGALDGHLYRLHPDSGEILGSFDTGGIPYGDLQVAGDCLLALWSGGGMSRAAAPLGPQHLACLAPRLASLRWDRPEEGEWSTPRPLIRSKTAGGGQVIAGHGGEIAAFSLETGEPRWRYPVDGEPRGLGASAEHLFMGTLSGVVWAIPWQALASTGREPETKVDAPRRD